MLRGINKSQQRLFVVVQQCSVCISRLDDSFAGSGVVLSNGPYVFTCAHVVMGMHSCKITRFIGDRHIQEIVDVVYISLDVDVAILKAKDSFRNYLVLSPSSPSGEVGYVFGYDADGVLKMSSGVTSAGLTPEAYIACHADHGYSGGPVTDYKGAVKGMVVGSKGIALHTTRYLTAESLDKAWKHFIQGKKGQHWS